MKLATLLNNQSAKLRYNSLETKRQRTMKRDNRKVQPCIISFTKLQSRMKQTDELRSRNSSSSNFGWLQLEPKSKTFTTVEPKPNLRWAWTGSGLNILQDTSDFFGSGLDLDIDFWKKLDQDRIRIFVWFLQRNLPENDSRCHKLWWSWSCFLCYNFYIHKKSKWFCHYVLHSSQWMIICVTLS